MLLGDILRRSATYFSEKEALVFGERTLTYRELNHRVNCLANGLLKLGLRKGDRLALVMHNCPEYIEIYFASAKIGGIFVPINNLLKRVELTGILDYVAPCILFMDPDYASLIGGLRNELSYIEFVMLHVISNSASWAPAIPPKDLFQNQ